MRRNLRRDFIFPGNSYIHLIISRCNARRWQVVGSEVQPSEGVKKSIIPVILSAAKNLQLFVFKKINADASLRSA